MRYAADTFTYREVQYRDGARLDNRLLIGDSICGSALVASHPLWCAQMYSISIQTQYMYCTFASLSSS